MAVVKVAANAFKVEVLTDPALQTWTEIKGLNSIEFSPSSERADTTSYDDGGWASHLLVQRGLSLTLEGFRLEDPDTGARDPGQEFVEDLGMAVGAAAVGTFRLTSPGGETIQFTATVDATPLGGGNTDAATWSAELQVTGEPTITRTGA